jgi:DNA-directed RNA polymerase specialized sigma24 family protein
MQPLADIRVIRPTEAALALKLVTDMDLLRLKTIARLHARGLPPDVAWDDLLQEAITRVLTGRRRKPDAVAMVAFLAGVMRSLRSEHWRRVRGGGAVVRQELAPDPERALIAAQELEAIGRLFADDLVVLRIITGLAEGLSPEEIRLAFGLSTTDYDSARRRMRRCLLREGLTCGQV